MSKFPREIRGQGSGSRFFKQFSSDTAGYSKSRLKLNVRKNASNKIIFQIFAFLIIAVALFIYTTKKIALTRGYKILYTDPVECSLCLCPLHHGLNQEKRGWRLHVPPRGKMSSNPLATNRVENNL